LGNEANGEARRETRAAKEVLLDAGHDAQQRALASTIATDDTDLGAAVEGQPDVLEYFALAVGFREVFDGVDVLFSHALFSRKDLINRRQRWTGAGVSVAGRGGKVKAKRKHGLSIHFPLLKIPSRRLRMQTFTGPLPLRAARDVNEERAHEPSDVAGAAAPDLGRWTWRVTVRCGADHAAATGPAERRVLRPFSSADYGWQFRSQICRGVAGPAAAPPP